MSPALDTRRSYLTRTEPGYRGRSEKSSPGTSAFGKVASGFAVVWDMADGEPGPSFRLAICWPEKNQPKPNPTSASIRAEARTPSTKKVGLSMIPFRIALSMLSQSYPHYILDEHHKTSLKA